MIISNPFLEYNTEKTRPNKCAESVKVNPRRNPRMCRVSSRIMFIKYHPIMPMFKKVCYAHHYLYYVLTMFKKLEVRADSVDMYKHQAL